MPDTIDIAALNQRAAEMAETLLGEGMTPDQAVLFFGMAAAKVAAKTGDTTKYAMLAKILSQSFNTAMFQETTGQYSQNRGLLGVAQ